MERCEGQSILEGIAIGKIWVYKKDRDTPYREEVEDVTGEIARFDAAREAALAELDTLIRETKREVGEEQAEVFLGHRMLVSDPQYRDYVCERIRNMHVNAAYAVTEAQAYFTRLLLGVDDVYMRERAADVADISERLLRLLCGWDAPQAPQEPFILAAEALMPSELMRFDRALILALVLQRGSVSSHTAILARARNLPTLFGVEVSEAWDGRTAVVDGMSGTIILDPDPDCLSRMKEQDSRIKARTAMREALRREETVTESGRKISLYANISEAADVEDALRAGAEGIGLFRSEFLYLQARDWPAEEEQFEAYRAAVGAMGGKRVVIRTLDAGADKQIPYLDLMPGGRERGIGICLDRPEMFRTQLRAILRAAACGPVAVMFPMVVSMEEVSACKAQLALAKEELLAAGVPCKDPEIGIMVETPEAVRLAEKLAREVDFFCIGTNDLIPLLLHVDRQEAGACAAGDPAVKEAIRSTIASGHAAGIRVGLCGEMAADPAMTKMLVEMGIDELSVSPESVLQVREAVRSIK